MTRQQFIKERVEPIERLAATMRRMVESLPEENDDGQAPLDELITTTLIEESVQGNQAFERDLSKEELDRIASEINSDSDALYQIVDVAGILCRKYGL